ncbi:MAG: non-canonical purine NTP pyrophosphatase [Candidatus Saccharimonadales bacterium]|jgi:non-canonical purine NTP pyrophosphatase (RdgB/HAM1 family)
MSLYFITGNKGKLAEAQEILPEIEGLDIDLPEIQGVDAHKIIEAKLQAALEHQEGEFIVEDTSLYYEGLNGLPGPLVKWFLETVGPDGLYKFAKGFNAYKATAKTIVGYAKDPDNIQFFEGNIDGEVVEPRGDQGFGFDPIFQPNGYNQTFAEMTLEEKNNLSMRKIAFNKLREYLGR